MTEYVVQTNLPPQMLSAVAVEIYGMWLDFAMGRSSINGRMLRHPTGRYASAIQFKQTKETQVAIFTLPGIAPEADILESGHARFDLKSAFQRGRAYPMHRGAGGAPTTRAALWGQMRNNSATGLASIGPNSKADSWILPAMPAYAPAQNLAELAAKYGRAGGLPG